MKTLKLIMCLLGCLFSLAIEATDKNNPNDAVSMVSYEQNWSDDNGSIALKNNTDTDIYNVKFSHARNVKRPCRCQEIVRHDTIKR